MAHLLGEPFSYFVSDFPVLKAFANSCSPCTWARDGISATG